MSLLTKQIRSGMLACLCLIVAAGACLAAGDEVETAKDDGDWQRVPLVNESFEEGESLPMGWRALVGNTVRGSIESIMAWDIEHARTGRRSLYIRRGGNGPLRWSNASVQQVTPGVRYQLRVWYRVDPSHAGTATLGVRSRRHFKDTGKVWEQGRHVEVSQDTQGQWQEMTMEFTPPETVDQVWLSLGQGGHWPPRGHGPVSIWFDDVSLWQKSP